MADSKKPATRVRACALHQGFPWRPTKTAPYDGFFIFVGLVSHAEAYAVGLGHSYSVVEHLIGTIALQLATLYGRCKIRVRT